MAAPVVIKVPDIQNLSAVGLVHLMLDHMVEHTSTTAYIAFSVEVGGEMHRLHGTFEIERMARRHDDRMAH